MISYPSHHILHISHYRGINTLLEEWKVKHFYRTEFLLASGMSQLKIQVYIFLNVSKQCSVKMMYYSFIQRTTPVASFGDRPHRYLIHQTSYVLIIYE